MTSTLLITAAESLVADVLDLRDDLARSPLTANTLGMDELLLESLAVLRQLHPTTSAAPPFKARVGNAARFHRPENYDKIKQLPGGYWMGAGANDWEVGWSAVGIHKGGDPRQTEPVEWSDIDHSGCPGCKGDIDAHWDRTSRKQCKDWAEQIAHDWVKDRLPTLGKGTKKPADENTITPSSQEIVTVNASAELEQLRSRAWRAAEWLENMADLVTNAEQQGDELTVMLRDAHRVLAKARASAVRNDDPEGRFITVRGHAVFIPKGKDVGEALKKHFDRVKAKGNGAGHEAEPRGHDRSNHPPTSGHGPAARGHGNHGEHAGHDPLEHTGHQAHAAQDIAAVHEALGGGHAAHAAIHDAHAAAEAAHAAGEVGHHGSGPLDAAAIGARHLYGPALKATSALMGRVPGLRTLGKAVGAIHEKATALNQKITEGLISRYGKATAGAILGVGSAMSHTVSHGVGLHGPAASALPGPHLIGAIPFVAMAEVGKRLGLVGEGTKLEKGLGVAGAWIHALRHGAGKAAGTATGKVAATGLRGAHLAGRLVGKVIRGAKRLTGNQLTELTLNGFVVVDGDSLDLWSPAGGGWLPLDGLLDPLAPTDNELTELLELVCNAEPENIEEDE